ncbi:hypothetical protein F5Y05DRAFT_296278 [Hypoxylon sp. FL0543]|nr:hypothetical protein F5Y05DRAFT_296278 [Hypoxylon sp. FL0543]
MSHMSRNSSSTSLMGFSVHQPAIGAPLQFFPAMGSKQLDEMIGTYVPGNAPIAEKRATVSMEFFEHTMATGELFKFFMVYPSLGSTTGSPASSMLDSGYVSNFTSPVMSESQWTRTGNASSSPSEPQGHKSSSKKASLSSDFSHLPGMKIMTRDGRDVTNSASRGCKTKEQRDHAHLMRIIKACDSCRRKKVRCDPSHKRSAGSSTKTSKKTKKTATASAPPPAPPQPALDSLEQFLFTPSFDITNDAGSSFDSVVPEPFVDPTMDWDQFVHFDEEPTEAVPYDYDFFFDAAGHLSPTSSNSFSSSQPITPAQALGAENLSIGVTEAEVQAPLPPYLNPGGEAGNNYADFNLYSPGSSTGLDDDPSLSKEVAAGPRLEHTQYSNHQRQLDDHAREIPAGDDQNFDTQLAVSVNTDRHAALFGQKQAPSPAGLERSLYEERITHTTSDYGSQLNQVPERRIPASPGRLRSLPSTRTGEPHLQPRAVSLVGVNVPLAEENVSTTRLHGSSSTLHEFQNGTSSPSTGGRRATTDQPGPQSSVAMLTSGVGAWGTASGDLMAPATVTIEASSGDGHGMPAQTVGLLHVLVRDVRLRHSQKSQPNDGTSSLRTTSLMSYRPDGISPSSNSPIPSTQSPRAITASRPVSTSVTELVLQDSLERGSLTARANYGLSSQNGLSSSAPKQSGRLAGTVLPGSLLETGKNTPSLDGLCQALSWVVRSVVLCLAIIALLRYRLSAETAEGLDMTPAVLGCLSLVSAYMKLGQHTTPCVDMLDETTQPLSFLGRFFSSVTTEIESRHSRLSRDFSRIQSNFEKDTSSQPREGNRGITHTQIHRQRLLGLA